MVPIVIITFFFILWIIWTYFFDNNTQDIPTAFAGSPSPQVPQIIKFKTLQRKVNYFIGEERVDVSKLSTVIIKGHSLERAGIKDNALVYVSLWNSLNKDYKSLIGRFIILEIDKERALAKNPMYTDYYKSEGKKARKVIDIIPIRMTEQELNGLCNKILANESEHEKHRLKEEILSKFDEASKFYTNKGETRLIMSLTYRNDGQDLGFSFHSVNKIFGVVEYVNNNPLLYKAS